MIVLRTLNDTKLTAVHRGAVRASSAWRCALKWYGAPCEPRAFQRSSPYSDFHPSWADRGWSRTIRDADAGLHDVSFHAHAIEDHLAALKRAGLHVHAIREPRFNEDADPGVKAFRRRWRNPQVIVVFHAVREP